MMLMYFLGAAICAIMLKTNKLLMRVELNAIARFLAFMALVTCFRLAMISAFGTSNFTLPSNKFWQLAMVWWEDAVFSIPIYLLSTSTKINKVVKISLIVIISMLFGLGHTYQGLFGVAITSLYPYFISTRYAKQHGFGTVMLCHILYDIITIGTIRLAPFIIGCIVG